MPALERKLVLVTRKTRLEELIARYQTLAQAAFHVEHLGGDFADYRDEHECYLAARNTVLAVLTRHGRYQAVERSYLPNFLFAPDDIVLALGQDGLVANTMKYLDGQPLVGLNPDKARYDGLLLPFAAEELSSILPELLADRRSCKTIRMARAQLSDGQVLHAVNDLFIGPRTHTSARYELSRGEVCETQSSSGVIVSTGLGSTAWIKSVVTGAMGVMLAPVKPDKRPPYKPLAWDAERLRFAVREPFPSKATQAGLVYGEIAGQERLTLRSLMPENGVIFSDGVEADYLDFNAGMEASIGVAERVGQLVM